MTTAAADEPGRCSAGTRSAAEDDTRGSIGGGASVASPATHSGDIIDRERRSYLQAPVLTSPSYPPHCAAGINSALGRHGGARMQVGTPLSMVYGCLRRVVSGAALSEWSVWHHRKVHEAQDKSGPVAPRRAVASLALLY